MSSYDGRDATEHVHISVPINIIQVLLVT